MKRKFDDDQMYFNHGSIFDKESDDMIWTTNDFSVGTSVAGFFICPETGTDKLYRGKVTRFCDNSDDRTNDKLYHVVWEDYDEQDFDEEEFIYHQVLYYYEFHNSTFTLDTSFFYASTTKADIIKNVSIDRKPLKKNCVNNTF